MKKIALMIIAFFALINVVDARKCEESELKEYRNQLHNISYELSYADYYSDMNGDFLEGFFKINVLNLPSGYIASVYGINGVQYSDFKNGMHLSGGVHKLEIYNDICDEAIKTFEIKIPHYKQFCELENKCEKENVWFDGTYENKTENVIEKKENKISMELVIVLVSLIVILIAGIIVIFIVRRRHNL